MTVAPSRLSRFLMMIYIVLPLAMLCVGLDVCFLNHTIQRSLPKSPEDLIFFSMIFVLPHVIASGVNLIDSEYIRFYRKKMLIGIPLSVFTFSTVWALFGIPAVYVSDMVLASYHGAAEQSGIARMFIKSGSSFFLLWRGLLILILTVFYSLFFFEKQIPGWMIPHVDSGILVILILLLITSWRLGRDSKTRFGFQYLWVITFSAGLGMFFLQIGYGFFTVLMYRMIHDLSSFAFYVNHDQNRNSEKPKNIFYRFTAPLGLPVYILLPAISIAFAFPLTLFEGRLLWVLGLSKIISFFHYYIEGVVWKRDSLHRQFVS